MAEAEDILLNKLLAFAPQVGFHDPDLLVAGPLLPGGDQAAGRVLGIFPRMGWGFLVGMGGGLVWPMRRAAGDDRGVGRA